MRSVQTYREIQKIRLEGKVIGYPFYVSNPKLGQFIPSIAKGKCIHITANTNVGKSQFWKWHFLVAPFLVYKMYPNANFKPRFIIFLLEETFEQLYDGLVSLMIFVQYKEIVEPALLRGGAEGIATNAQLDMADAVEPIVEELLSYCKIYDNVYNPTGLYRLSRAEILKYGKRFYTTLIDSDIVITEEQYNGLNDKEKEKFKFKKFVENDPSQYIFIITDNVNLLEQEMEGDRLLNLQETMWKWSTGYAHKQLQKNFHCIVIDIVQQVGDQEKQQFTNFGSSIVEKIKPSRDGYGDNKRIARNADVIIGLFAPSFYGLTSYNGFNLEGIGDFFRTAIILKNRLGRGFKEIPLFFNGAVNYFTEINELGTKERDLIKKGIFQKGFKKLGS